MLRQVVKAVIMENRRYAVLTGDIIQSSRLSAKELETVRDALHGGVEAIRNWERGLVRGKLQFFRGDSWQLLLTRPAISLRAAIYLRAVLIAGKLPDSRIAIGIGPVSHIDPKQISRSTGPAFTLSGEALDSVLDNERMTLRLPNDQNPSTWPVVVRLCDALIRTWKPWEARVVTPAIQPGWPTQQTISTALRPSISQQSVSKALSNAQFPAIKKAVQAFESSPDLGIES